MTNIPESNKVGYEDLLDRIFERVSVIPSKSQLKEYVDLIADELNANLEHSSTAIENTLRHIAETTTKVPVEMSKEFRKDMKELLRDIAENLQQRDAIYSKRLQDYKEVVLAL